MDYVIGIDEVGRGPVAGPVVVCACAIGKGVNLLPLFPKEKLRDSKKLSEKVRSEIVQKLQLYIDASSVIFGIGQVSAERIDTIGISAAIKEALAMALLEVHGKGVAKDSFIFLDGSLYANEVYEQETIIKGDEKIIEISLASILAKEYRDAYMRKISAQYPGYGFESHVGYGTKAHYDAIAQKGFTPLHRKTFLRSLHK